MLRAARLVTTGTLTVAMLATSASAALACTGHPPHNIKAVNAKVERELKIIKALERREKHDLKLLSGTGHGPGATPPTPDQQLIAQLTKTAMTDDDDWGVILLALKQCLQALKVQIFEQRIQYAAMWAEKIPPLQSELDTLTQAVASGGTLTAAQQQEAQSISTQLAAQQAPLTVQLQLVAELKKDRTCTMGPASAPASSG